MLLHAPKGLDGIVVTTTQISKIDGQAGKLIYRGYDIAQLAGNAPFEAVAHLLWRGRLPSPAELESLKNKRAEIRYGPANVRAFLETAPRDASPLSILRTA